MARQFVTGGLNLKLTDQRERCKQRKTLYVCECECAVSQVEMEHYPHKATL